MGAAAPAFVKGRVCVSAGALFWESWRTVKDAVARALAGKKSLTAHFGSFRVRALLLQPISCLVGVGLVGGYISWTDTPKLMTIY